MISYLFVQVDSAAVPRTRSNIMISNFIVYTFVHLSECGNLYPATGGLHASLSFTYMLAFANQRARALRTIHLVIFMFTIDRDKVIQLRDRITTYFLPAFPPIRRTRLTMLIVHPPCISTTHHI